MPEETCYEEDCCPLGITVPTISGVLALAGEDSTGTDPNIANGDLLLLEQGYQTRASTTSGSNLITVSAYSGLPIQIGQRVSVVGIYKLMSITGGSNVASISNAAGLPTSPSAGVLRFFEEFVYQSLPVLPLDSYVTGISGTNVTFSQNAAYTVSNRSVLFYRTNASGIPTNIIATPTTVTGVSGTTITLSGSATTTTSELLVNFSPSIIDPNVTDGYEIYT
jgi:hypothetical protein